MQGTGSSHAGSHQGGWHNNGNGNGTGCGNGGGEDSDGMHGGHSCDDDYSDTDEDDGGSSKDMED